MKTLSLIQGAALLLLMVATVVMVAPDHAVRLVLP